MNGLVIFWGVLAIAGVAFAVVTRVYPLSFAAFGFAVASIVAMQDGALWMQALIAIVLLGVALYFWVRRTRLDQLAERDSAHSHLTGIPSLSQFSVFSDETDEVNITQWNADGTTDIVFRGREWRAKLSRGAKAHAGVYKVREVRDGMLVLDEVID